MNLRAAAVLALIALVSSLPFYSFAQGDVVPVKKSRNYTVAPDKGSFILYAGPNGETLCREATRAEAQVISKANPGGLRQINHLKDDLSAEGATGLTIVLRGTAQLDANPQAKQAFIDAAAKWEAVVKNQINIVIDVDFGTKFFGADFSGPTVIGATSSPQFFSPGNYPEVRTRLINRANGPADALASSLPPNAVPVDRAPGTTDTVLISSPLLRALGLFGQDYVNDPSTRPQPKVAFNSAFGFDFNPNDGISPALTDFDAVAVHEIGHVLGFSSSVGDQELDPTDALQPTVWDLFRFRPGTATNAATFGTANRILTSDGAHVQFTGGAELALSTGRPDGTGGDEEQASHWKEDFGNPLNYIGVMDPTIARGVRELMTINDQNTIDSLGYTTTPVSAPANDNFGSSEIITGNSGTVTGSNTFATRETGEPIHSPDSVPTGSSIWYRWTAPNSGQVTITTDGSNYDTVLAVYTGSAVNGLTLIASNDDVVLGDIVSSIVQFSAVGGTTYQIAVDGYGGDQGNVTLNWNLPGGATPTPTPTPTPSPTPGPNSVQFSLSVASINETDTVPLNLLVTRTGDTAQAATVDYASSNGSANDRKDYEVVLGTLNFAAGETSKTIPVFAINDVYGESAETFNVTLSNPVACSVGSPSAMAITINSDETVNGANPVVTASFNTDFFVRQHYPDFFNRQPDNSGLAFWKNEIDSCATQSCRDVRRINVSAAFFLSIEFQETGYLIERLYKTAYGDGVGTSTLGGTHQISVPIVRLNEFLPDTQRIGRGVVIGSSGWEQLLESNKQALFAEFVQRTRFTTKYPTSMTPGEFVNQLSANAGPGVISTTERDQLVNALTNATMTRAQVLRAVAEDSNLFAAETNRAFVLAQFFGYLRRNPNDTPDSDYTGYDFWLGKLNQFSGNYVNAEMVKAFIESTEYVQRFGP